MKPPKPKPMKPTLRWAIVDADEVVQWVAPIDGNTRTAARSRLGLFYAPTEGDRIIRVLITEVPSGLA